MDSILIGPGKTPQAVRDLETGPWPIKVRVVSHLTLRLSLPEAGLHLAPLERKVVIFSSFAVLQRCVTSLAQIAAQWQVPTIVEMTPMFPRPAAPPAPAPAPAPPAPAPAPAPPAPAPAPPAPAPEGKRRSYIPPVSKPGPEPEKTQ